MICLRWWQLFLVFYVLNAVGEGLGKLTKLAIRRHQGKQTVARILDIPCSVCGDPACRCWWHIDTRRKYAHSDGVGE